MTAGRVSPVAAYGSLLKGASVEKKKKLDMGRNVRVRNEEHLDAVRSCACLACGADPAGEAAHVRMTAPGKVAPGMGKRPDDEYAVPLCHACHMKQHEQGELPYWRSLGLDPLKVAAALYRLSPHVEAMRAAVFAAHAVTSS